MTPRSTMTGTGARAPDEGGHEWRGRAAVEFGRCSELLQPPGAEQRHSIAQLEGLILLVRHQHRGDADAPDHLAQFATGPLAQGGIEVRERLVEQEDARLRRQRTRQRHALLLPAGELADAPALQAGEVHLLECLADPASRCRRAGAPMASSPKATFCPTSRWGKSA